MTQSATLQYVEGEPEFRFALAQRVLSSAVKISQASTFVSDANWAACCDDIYISLGLKLQHSTKRNVMRVLTHYDLVSLVSDNVRGSGKIVLDSGFTSARKIQEGATLLDILPGARDKVLATRKYAARIVALTTRMTEHTGRCTGLGIYMSQKRTEREITLVELSEMLLQKGLKQCGSVYLSSIERGKVPMPYIVFCRICEVMSFDNQETVRFAEAADTVIF